MTKVKVVAFKDGSVLKQNERKPNKSYFRVHSSEMTFSNGNANVQNRYATISIDTKAGQDMNLFEGKEIEGRIVFTESLEPAYEGQEPKRAGQDGPVLTKDGSPIYRSSSLESADKADTLIAYTNVEEVKEYNATQADAGTLDM